MNPVNNTEDTLTESNDLYEQGTEDLKTEIKTLVKYSDDYLSSRDIYRRFESYFGSEDNFYSEEDLEYVSRALVEMRNDKEVEKTAFLQEDGAKIVYRLSE